MTVVVVPTESGLPEVWDEVNVATAQLSDAVGSVHVTAVSHSAGGGSNVMSAGMPEIVGAVLSVTVTLNEAVPVFPEVSDPVYVTVVVPTGKVEPGAWEEVWLTPGQLSAAVGAVQVAAALQLPASALTVMSAGTPVKVGFWSSTTITLKVPVEELP